MTDSLFDPSAFETCPHGVASDVFCWQCEKAVYPPNLYDGRPPAEPKDEAGTSRLAASMARPNAAKDRAKILAEIRSAGYEGRTDDENERALGMLHQTASARRRELVLLREVMDSGRRRRTRSGRTAVVWVVREIR